MTTLNHRNNVLTFKHLKLSYLSKVNGPTRNKLI